MISRIASLFIVVAIAASDAFVQPERPQTYRASTELFGQVKLTHNGRSGQFGEGSPLKNACAKLGVKPKFSCRKGDCGSCTVSVGGSRIKACVGKVPPQPRLKSLQEKGLEIR